MFSNIVVAHDGSACSDLALDYAISLAETFHANLTVCHVTDYSAAALVMAGPVLNAPGPVFDVLNAEGRIVTDHVREYAAKAGIEATVRDIGDTPASGILSAAKNAGADLVVVGSHGKHGLQKLFDPSISTRIAGEAHVPVLIVPHDANACS